MKKLPAGFQRSEFLIEKGAIDMIVRRPEMRDKLAEILAMLTHQTVQDASQMDVITLVDDDLEPPYREKPEIDNKSDQNDNISDPLMIPEATSSLASWLTYLTNQHNKIIDMGLDRVGIVARQLDLYNRHRKWLRLQEQMVKELPAIHWKLF